MERPGRLDHRTDDALDPNDAGLIHVADCLAAAHLHCQPEARRGDHVLQSHCLLDAGAFGLELRLDADHVMVFAKVLQLIDHLPFEFVHLCSTGSRS